MISVYLLLDCFPTDLAFPSAADFQFTDDTDFRPVRSGMMQIFFSAFPFSQNQNKKLDQPIGKPSLIWRDYLFLR